MSQRKSTSKEDVVRRLTRRGLRLTRQREVVLKAIRSSGGHPDAHDIYARARRVMPQISLGTVYRTLGLLRDAGVIQELHFGRPHGRFEELVEHHHHVVCKQCGRIEDISAKSLNLLAKVQELTAFEVQEQRLEFYGLCPKCRVNRQAPGLE